MRPRAFALAFPGEPLVPDAPVCIVTDESLPLMALSVNQTPDEFMAATEEMLAHGWLIEVDPAGCRRRVREVIE